MENLIPFTSGTSTPPKTLMHFTRLSKCVRLYDPASPGPSDSKDPTTILLCAWMNAAPKHIAYYANHYMATYPHARIIITSCSTTEFLFQSETRRRADMKPAVTALLAVDQATDRLLVHGLSNGGCRRVYNISAVYRSITGKPLPARAFITDSAGGIPQFRRDLHALQVPARNFSWFLFIPYITFAYASVSLVFVVVNWMPKWFWRDLVWGPLEGNNDPQLLDNRGVKGYVYSKEDLAMDWRHIERHADVAEGKGFRVERKLIEGAEHVQMFRGKGGERDYWGFVERTWGLGVGFS